MTDCYTFSRYFITRQKHQSTDSEILADIWTVSISGYIFGARQTAIQNWSLFYAFSSVRSLSRCRKIVINFRVKVQICFKLLMQLSTWSMKSFLAKRKLHSIYFCIFLLDLKYLKWKYFKNYWQRIVSGKMLLKFFGVNIHSTLCFWGKTKNKIVISWNLSLATICSVRIN